MIGQTLGHYRVVEQIGSGGMGVVYRAHDIRLDRDVALKAIRPGMLNERPARDRFRKEARLLSKLCHPNIAQVYDFDTQEGVDFLIMEFVKGTTLASTLANGPMSEEMSITVGIQIASALENAAEEGIVHRDLKPSNTMITTRGNVKVLDFGLARLLRSEDANVTESLESAGGVGGTLPYMAPEQLRGEPADFRSDIYSLGVVLYEVSTGNRPFNSRISTGLISDILNKSPEPLRKTNSGLSLGFENVVLRCLAKDPQRRYQNAGEARVALESLRGGGEIATPPNANARAMRVFAVTAALLLVTWFGILASWRSSKRVPKVDAAVANQLAVLPLSTTQGNSESLAFDDGLVETLTSRLTQLSRNHPLQVVPASEVRARGVTNLQGAREQFGATLGLQLNVQRSGDLVRVNYSLVDTKSHRQLGGDTITAPASDPFSLEDRVAESIVKSLEIKLQPQEERALVAHGTDRPSAYDYYLQGRGYLQEPQKRENIDSAITVFGHALEQDPSYALAIAGLGEAYWRHYELDQETRWARQAQSSCEKAIATNSDYAESHSCLGMVYEGTGKYNDAVIQYRKAVELDPTSDDAIRGLASAYAKLGKTDDAEKTFQVAIAARPQYWKGYNSLGALYAGEGRYEESAKMFTQVIALAPDSFRGYSNLGAVYIRQGRYPEAVKLLQSSIAIRPTEDSFSNLGTAFFALRQFDRAAKNYGEATRLDDQDYVVWGNLADSYYYAGNRADAIPAFRKAVSLATLSLGVNPRDASVLSAVAGYNAMLGNRTEAFEYLEKALGLTGAKDPEVLFEAAMVHNQFGETAKALEWLDKAREAGFSSTTISDAPALDNLHGNHKFQDILSRQPDHGGHE
jgi:tetratricopeptide (TPR) repeat protein/TolB-like protein/predicted Ser/Thr protein kinase